MTTDDIQKIETTLKTAKQLLVDLEHLKQLNPRTASAIKWGCESNSERSETLAKRLPQIVAAEIKRVETELGALSIVALTQIDDAPLADQCTLATAVAGYDGYMEPYRQ